MHDGDTGQVLDGKDLPPLGPGLDSRRRPRRPPPARTRSRPGPAGHLPIEPDEAAVQPFARGHRARSLPPWRVLAVIAVGGFFGGRASCELGLAFPARHGAFPVASFAINVSLFGAVSRCLLDRAVVRNRACALPAGTWIINITGSFVLGPLTGLVARHGLSPQVVTVAGTGGVRRLHDGLELQPRDGAAGRRRCRTGRRRRCRRQSRRRAGAAALGLGVALP